MTLFFCRVYLSGSYDKIVRIFDSKTSTLKASCVGHTDSITAISPILGLLNDRIDEIDVSFSSF